jgi:hypothetical protein
MGLGVIITFGWLSGTCALTDAEHVPLENRTLRLGDIATLECVREEDRPQLSTLVITKLPRAPRDVVTSAGELAGLAKRRVPGLDLAPPADPSRLIVIEAGPSVLPRSASTACYRTSRSVGAGKAISGDDLSPTACEADQPKAQLSFDRANKVVRAASDIGPGVYVGRLSVPERAFPDTGDELVLSIGLGAVAIERQVRAAQPSPSGGSIFVRDETGALFRAPVAPSHAEGAKQ